jgi:hypothetical protein
MPGLPIGASHPRAGFRLVVVVLSPVAAMNAVEISSRSRNAQGAGIWAASSRLPLVGRSNAANHFATGGDPLSTGQLHPRVGFHVMFLH